MKKNSSKPTFSTVSKRALVRSMMPNGLLRWCRRVRIAANRNPRRTVAILLAGVALNVGLVIYVSEQSKQQPFSYSSISPIKLVGRQWDTVSMRAADIPFTWKNFQEISSLKDSLEYLMRKTERNAEDTLLFIRIFEKYARLDPSFAKAVIKDTPQH
jgi:hypothetical protein